MMKRGWVTPVILGILALVLPFTISSYYQHILILVIIWITMSSAWNLLGGFAGQVMKLCNIPCCYVSMRDIFLE